MEDIMTWLVPIIVAAITGGFSYLGVYKSVKASHDKMLFDMKVEQDKLAINTSNQIESIKDDIKRLEKKQDEHNNLIKRTYELERKVSILETKVK